MNKQIEIIEKIQYQEYVMFDIINENGDMDVVSLDGLGELIVQGYEFNIEEDDNGVVVDENLYNIDVSYMEVVIEDEVVDVYYHKLVVDNGMAKFERGGEFVKSYKSEKAAVRYAQNQNLNGAIVIN